jgi:hypothetical protein
MLLPALSSVNLRLCADEAIALPHTRPMQLAGCGLVQTSAWLASADFSSFGVLPVDKVFFECDDALALLLALRWRTGGRWGQATVRGSDEWSATT